MRVEQRARDRATLDADGVTFSENAILQMKSKGVTTVICVCALFVSQYLSSAATKQGYFPEWVLSTYWGNDFNVGIKLSWGSDQRKSVFGISSAPPMRSDVYEPAFYAAREADPQTDPKGLDQLLNVYRGLLVLASGVQMAGPHLTPETFAAGLRGSIFPYPPDDPTHSGDVGFLDGDHSMTDDFTEFWWSESARSPDLHVSWSNGDPGALCYVDGGARRRLGRWPNGPDPFFQGPCDPDGGPP